ncbi:MAG: EamA family transporter [Clostridia bacterium]|nr:EamA family transporter [Clostridia bacterium]
MKNASALYVLLAGILWGTMGVFSTYLNSLGMGSFEVAQVRITLGLVIVAVYLVIFNRKMFKVKIKDLWCFFGTGVISLLFFSCCYFASIEMTSLSVAAVLLYTAPTFVMVMSLFLFREKLTGNKILALLMSFVGCILVSGVLTGGKVSTVGILLGLGSGFFYALYSIFGRYAINRGYESWTIVLYTFLFCSAGCAFFADWSVICDAAVSSPNIWLILLGLGFVTAFLPYVFYSKGLEKLESSKASIIASVEPVVGTIMGMIFFDQFPDVWGYIGIALVIGAIVMLNVKFRAKEKSIK